MVDTTAATNTETNLNYVRRIDDVCGYQYERVQLPASERTTRLTLQKNAQRRKDGTEQNKFHVTNKDSSGSLLYAGEHTIYTSNNDSNISLKYVLLPRCIWQAVEVPNERMLARMRFGFIFVNLQLILRK